LSICNNSGLIIEPQPFSRPWLVLLRCHFLLTMFPRRSSGTNRPLPFLPSRLRIPDYLFFLTGVGKNLISNLSRHVATNSMINRDWNRHYNIVRIWENISSSLNVRTSRGNPKYCILGELCVTTKFWITPNPRTGWWNATWCARMCFRMGAVYKLITLLSLSTTKLNKLCKRARRRAAFVILAPMLVH